MRANWQIGSLFGIPLYVDSSWFLVLIFVTIVNAGEINAMGLRDVSPLLGWMGALMMALLLFTSVLFHELGHSLVARSQGIKVNSITLFLFGGIASIDKESETPKEALWVAICGPAVSLLLFGVFSALSTLFDSLSLMGLLTANLAQINLVLAVFNLIPGLPLDGGQILKAIVWKATGDRLIGMRWAAASGQLLGWLGICLGLFVLFLTGELGGLWLTLIGWFILQNATAYERLTVIQQTLLELVAANAMTQEFRVVNAHLTLRQFVEEYLLSELLTVPCAYYAASEGRYRGLLRVSELQRIERGQWDTLTLMDVVHPLPEIPSVTEKTSLMEVIKKLENVSDSRITVLSPAGAVAGVIDRGDLIKAIATKNNLPIPELEIKRIKSEGTYPSYLQLNAIAETYGDQYETGNKI